MITTLGGNAADPGGSRYGHSHTAATPKDETLQHICLVFTKAWGLRNAPHSKVLCKTSKEWAERPTFISRGNYCGIA